MRVHQLSAHPSADLTRALERFEAQFTYPLGPGRYFRISHGDDYPRFFRAMGEAACFIAERQGEVLGTLGAALRRLSLPDAEECLTLYLGDLKIAPVARGGRTLIHLIRAVQQWAGSRITAAFSVVMDGTSATPEQYTGRLNIPSFQALGKITVLRLPTLRGSADPSGILQSTRELIETCYQRLSEGRYACPGGTPTERSEIDPIWLLADNGRACGRLEDTRRAKRLVADDGVEMQSAHLSCFAYADLPTGVRLLRLALCWAANRGFPALFVAVPAPEGDAFCKALEGMEVVAAPATVYGTGLVPGPLWNMNTAEI